MTKQQDDQFNSGPAYKQPWFWLIMAPLMTTIVVGTSMLVYSLFSYDGRSIDQYTKDGFDVTKSFAREQKAHSLNITANAKLEVNVLTVNLEGDLIELPEQLLLTIYSPASKIQDVEVHLTLNGDIYMAEIELNELSKRTMQIIDPQNDTWLIQTKSAWPIMNDVTFTPYMSVY